MQEKCDVCYSTNIFVTTRFTLANWPYVLLCGDCGASIGCHIDTTQPIGKMASGSLRYLRKLAHISFDKIWKSGFMTRDRAIGWMGKELLKVDRFHISTSTYRELLQCINISEAYCRKKGNHRIQAGRQKQNDKFKRSFQRVAKHNAINSDKRKSKRANAINRSRYRTK